MWLYLLDNWKHWFEAEGKGQAWKEFWKSFSKGFGCELACKEWYVESRHDSKAAAGEELLGERLRSPQQGKREREELKMLTRKKFLEMRVQWGKSSREDPWLEHQCC